MIALLAALPLLFPNPTMTPGSVQTTTKAFCTPGWSRAHRQVSSSMRRAVYKAYGYPGPQPGWELDHLIPLELGGSNARTNLWPEPPTPADRGFHRKDKVENAAHDAVCEGRMTVRVAQKAMAKNWYTLGQRLGVIGAS